LILQNTITTTSKCEYSQVFNQKSEVRMRNREKERRGEERRGEERRGEERRGEESVT
jgi:hypothetical protein